MKVPALRIEVNGELVAVAGADGLSLLSGQVGFGADAQKYIDLDSVMFNVMGLSLGGPTPQQLSWATDVRLKLGDKVSFQVVEADHPSPPSKSIKTPSSEELAAVAAAERKQRGRSGPKV